ncbi:MDR family NADP-dependent oxidoreductase [Burkholderia guangdongensis]|uniref:MDR family NADP-dependent oxidoreductase n=1 Tax=Burkholderia guangdongensis TaxID=1792500 RepID=UPI0015CA194B|nr:NADP-dependent oxidoreductase [Burkholderia guangdongensis]
MPMPTEIASEHPALPEHFRQWVVKGGLAQHELREQHFEQRIVSMPQPQDGEALVRIKLINVHAATRMRIARGLIPEGATDPNNYACAEVVRSRDPAFAVGDVIACQAGWQEYQIVRSSDLPVGFGEPDELVKALNRTRSPWTYVFRPALVRMWSPEVLMEIFGTSGMTAWFGMREQGPLMPRDSVAVAASTGSVGSIVAQIAKAAGSRVVGFAGGPDRCRWVREHLGIDACVDYTADDFDDALRAAFPEGIDVFSDGVGGALTERVVPHMNRHARLFSYGSAAASYAADIGDAPSRKPTIREIFGINATVERVLRERHIKSGAWTVDSFYHERLRAEDELSRLLRMGLIRSHCRTVRGFERLPDAIAGQYRDRGIGKLQISFE